MCNYIINFRMYVKYVILGGQFTQTQEEKLIVVRWIIYVHKYWKDKTMIIVLIYGR